MATYEVTLPDGTTYEVDTPDVPQSGQGGAVDAINSALIGGGQIAKGYTFGLGDEASAAIGAVGNKLLDKTLGTDLTGNMSVGQAYDAYLSQIRGEDKQFEQQSPWGSLALQVTGGIASPVSRALAGLGLLKGGAIGGGLFGFGESEGGAGGRAVGTGIGATVGGAT